MDANGIKQGSYSKMTYKHAARMDANGIKQGSYSKMTYKHAAEY